MSHHKQRGRGPRARRGVQTTKGSRNRTGTRTSGRAVTLRQTGTAAPTPARNNGPTRDEHQAHGRAHGRARRPDDRSANQATDGTATRTLVTRTLANRTLVTRTLAARTFANRTLANRATPGHAGRRRRPDREGRLRCRRPASTCLRWLRSASRAVTWASHLLKRVGMRGRP